MPGVGELIQTGAAAYLVVAVLAHERAAAVYLGIRRGPGIAAALLLGAPGGWQVALLPADLPLLDAVGRMLRGQGGRRLVAWDPDWLPISGAADLLPAHGDLR
jgi:hypothetical protein